MPQVVVVGAGVFGTWTAHHLLAAGCAVTLVDAYGPANPRASSGDQSRILRCGYGADEIYSDFRTNATFTTPGGVPTLVVTGPFNATGAGDTPSRRAIFSCKPTSAPEEATCARTILTRRAVRSRCL